MRTTLLDIYLVVYIYYTKTTLSNEREQKNLKIKQKKPVGATTHPTGSRVNLEIHLNTQCKITQALFFINSRTTHQPYKG